MELLKILAIFAIILFILWIFPPTHKLLIEFYESNTIVKTIIDIIGNIFKGLGEGVVEFFSRLFNGEGHNV